MAQHRFIVLDAVNYHVVNLQILAYRTNYEVNPGKSTDDGLFDNLSRLDPNMLMHDTFFLINAGELLEAIYLSRRQTADNPLAFYVYNISLWGNMRKSTRFISNLFLKEKMPNDFPTRRYIELGTEFYCIDSLVLSLENLKATSKIHTISSELVKNKLTGGCIW
jgi:hypothetical protein